MNRSTSKWLAGGAAAVVLVGAIVFLLLNRGTAGPITLLPSSSPNASPTPSPTLNQDLLNRRMTVLFIGLDTSEGRRDRGVNVRNTDSLMLASVSADQSELALVNLPRDTVDVPLPDGTIWTRKVNAIFALEGVETLVGALEELLAVPIDGYVQIDMDDFATLVEAAGGIRVAPEEPLVDRTKDLNLSAGPQHVDGETALDYVRTRVDNDYERMARQQEALLDLGPRLLSPRADIDWSALLESLNSFGTDLPLNDLPTLIELARRAQDADVTRLVLGPEFITFEGDAGDGRGYILVPDVEAMRRAVDRAIGDG
ncbi:MAG TPA: LCP family protein [Candidatus Limnocylindria bacterium]|nr:LCP family protein [Candidatus Limnocylindria bacterium]